MDFDDRIILTPRNDDADEINEIVLNNFDLENEIKIYYSFDEAKEIQNLNVPVEFLNNLN